MQFQKTAVQVKLDAYLSKDVTGFVAEFPRFPTVLERR